MSPNRKAELQRKLAMAPVAKPPAGLAERIKSEIPQELKFDAERERRRFSHSIAFNLRVAASILLLVSSVYLALRVLSRYETRPTLGAESKRVELPATAPVKAAPKPPQQAPLTVADTGGEETRAHVEPATTIAELEKKPRLQAAPPAPPPPRVAREAAPAFAPQIAHNTESQRATAGGAAPTTAAASAPIAEPAAAAAPMAKAAATTGYVGSVVPEARAEDLALSPKTLFGVSLKSTVQQFSAPASTPEHVRLDVEAATIDERPTLRISIDTPEEAHPAGGSRPPAAADARLEIAFNPEAVASQKPLVGPIASSAPALPSSESVTALYGLELKPELARAQVIATVVLHYRDVVTGRNHVISRTVRLKDVKPWEHASRRTKSAILAEAIASRGMPLDDIIARANAAGLSDVAAYAEEQKR